MKCLSIASTKQNGHTRTPSLPAFLAFNRISSILLRACYPWENVLALRTLLLTLVSPYLEALSSGRSPPPSAFRVIFTRTSGFVFFLFFSFLFFSLSNFSRRVCVVFEISQMPARNSRLFICLWSEFPLGWPWTPKILVKHDASRRMQERKTGFVISRVFHHLGMACVAVHKNPLMNIPAGFLSRKIVAGRSESFCMLDSHEPWERRFRGPCVLPARDRGTWAKKSLLLATVITRETFGYLDTITFGKGFERGSSNARGMPIYKCLAGEENRILRSTIQK